MKFMFKYPLQRRIFIAVSCLVLLPYLVLSFPLFSYYRNYQEERKAQQYTSMLHIAEMMLIHNIAQVENTINSLTTSRSVKKALQGKNRNETALTLLFDVNNDLAMCTASLREHHAEIYLITLDEDTFERYNQFYHLSRFEGDREFMEFMEGSGLTTWLSPRKTQGSMPLYTGSEYTVIPFCHKVKELSKTGGVIMCSVRAEDIFFSALEELSQYGRVQVQMDGVSIYSVEDGKEQDLGEAAESPKNSYSLSTQSAQYPYKITLEVFDGGTGLGVYFINFLLWSCLAYLAMISIIAVVLSTLLKKLNFVSELLLVLDPNLDGQRIPYLGDNEINILGDSINKLLSKVENQRHELLASERERRRAEQSALQLQMNPHLLFNSLHWLWLNLSDESKSVQRGVELLGELYRYNLIDGSFVDIGQELKNAETYVEMMCLLKDKGITLNVVCPQALLAGNIPRFTLQPIVENAIKHGHHKDAPIRIDICFTIKENMLEISISNDGSPIARHMVNKLNESLSRRENASHIGLVNLAQRLYLNYGTDGSLRLDSENGITTVTVSIPLREVMP